MKAYRLIDPNTHDLFFHINVQFYENLPNPPSSYPSLILSESHDTSSEDFHDEDIPNDTSPIIAIDPPPYVVAATPPVDVASSSTASSHMPKWGHFALEDATPFI